MTLIEIKSLIDKLGFKIKELKEIHCLQLHDKNTNNIIYCDNESGIGLSLFNGYYDIAYGLLENIFKFEINGNFVSNPCLGCKTYEEACMKIDLCLNDKV